MVAGFADSPALLVIDIKTSETTGVLKLEHITGSVLGNTAAGLEIVTGAVGNGKPLIIGTPARIITGIEISKLNIQGTAAGVNGGLLLFRAATAALAGLVIKSETGFAALSDHLGVFGGTTRADIEERLT